MTQAPQTLNTSGVGSDPTLAGSEGGASVRDRATQVGGTAKDEAAAVAQEMKYQARDLMGEARSQVRQQVDTQKGRVSDLLRDLSEAHGSPELTDGVAEPAQHLGLQLDPVEAAAVRRAQDRGDAVSVQSEPDPRSGAPGPRIVAGVEEDLPRVSRAAELAREARLRGHLTVTQPTQGSGEVGRLDGEPFDHELPRRIDERGLLYPREVETRGDLPGPARENSDRRDQQDQGDDRDPALAAPEGSAGAADVAGGPVGRQAEASAGACQAVTPGMVTRDLGR